MTVEERNRQADTAAAAQDGPLLVGLDIGSVSAKLVILGEADRVLEDYYVRTRGQPIVTARRLIADVLARCPRHRIAGLALTGNGGKRLANLLGIDAVNEIVAQSAGTAASHPEVRTIIEMGGEDSKLIQVERAAGSGEPRITDFAMNTVCAAGTGSFLDQQAARLGVSIEDEFGELALKSESPPRIAGRCSVFAKTDMIHLQQEAT
ncbi:MAG: BadF/BadG/BcrA/BcrD ATPase family protein, partial [Planctomycetota bacterium]